MADELDIFTMALHVFRSVVGLSERIRYKEKTVGSISLNPRQNPECSGFLEQKLIIHYLRNIYHGDFKDMCQPYLSRPLNYR